MQGPLHGIRVIDMTAVGMGPWATQLLGDMGADVVKIEPPDGDIVRHVAPQRSAGMGHAFLNLNRNKRSVVLDAKSQRGAEAIRRLAASADVFVTNVRPAATRRLGLDYEALARSNARLVYCACYGYGESGPYAGRPGVDDTIQAACGLAAMQGFGAAAPSFVHSIIVDKILGIQVAHAITLALLARERTGQGQRVDVPMFETMVAFMAPEHLAGLSFDPPLGPAGYSRVLNPYRKPFRTKDGYLAVLPYTDAQWRRFFSITGQPSLADDPRYRTSHARSSRAAELYRYVEECLAGRSTAEWEVALRDADIPFAPVKSMEDLLDDPHLLAVGFWKTVEHPTEGRLRSPDIPVKLSKTPGSIRRHAPGLGEHTEEVLREAGLADLLPPAPSKEKH